MQKVSSWILRYRYLLLSGVVFALMCLSISKQYWVDDFWEHAAVIRELAAHPLHPQHPLLSLDAPHALFTPYALFWGLFARLTGFSPIKTLSIAGIINCFLFLVGLYLFISAIAAKDRDGVAFYSLLFILLLWGPLAWNFSAFFHLRELGYILPYPSTFSMALAFMVLAMNKRRVETRRDLWLLPIVILSTLVLLSHQFTFIFLASGILAMTLSARGRFWAELGRAAAMFIVMLLLAVLWPYYPLLHLMLGASAVYDTTQIDLYRSVLIRIWPALIGIPLLALELRSDWRKPLPWMFAMLVGVYLLGGLIKSYSYGREISYIVYILDFTIAIYLVKLEHLIQVRTPRFPALPLAFSAGVSLLIIALTFKPFISPALDRSLFTARKSYADYIFLTNYDDAVILADRGYGKMVPAFGGKLVGDATDLPFVPDALARLNAVDQFFSENATTAERLDVLQKYRVQYVLLQKSRASGWQALLAFMKGYGNVVFENRRFVLIKNNG